MPWSAEQQARLGAEYARIGYQAGERWPAPPNDMTPETILQLLASVPDGAGLAGFQQALAKHAR